MQRTELKALVPYGYAKLIAMKSKTSRMTVSAFLNGKNDNITIELATLEVLAELQEKRNSLIAKIKA
jgi:hypothetical protein